MACRSHARKHRTYGTGPTYRKIGGRVVYAVDDLKAWADRGAKTSTSDPGKGTVLPAKKPALRPYAARNVADCRVRVVTMRRKHHSERDQQLFRALPGDLAPRDSHLMAYPFFSLAKTKRIVPIDFRAGAIAIRVEAVPEHGMATIWDARRSDLGRVPGCRSP